MPASVVSIIVGPQGREILTAVARIRAVPGRGLEGDRYFHKVGSFNRPPLAEDGRELTLIEQEAIDACNAALGTELEAWQFRRNLVTKGVRLNELVDRTFQVGPVTVRGLRVCHPCRFLQRLTGADVMVGLKGIGGLRAAILSEGEIAVGDAVVSQEAPG